MAEQLHKKFDNKHVKNLIQRYLNKELERKYLQEILGIGKTRFFALIKTYKEDSDNFSIQYCRKRKTRSIPLNIENNIIKELSIDKKLIEDINVPTKRYNYSYIKDRLEKEYHQKVSLYTVIDRAKKHGFYLKKKHKKAVHDREVLTNYTGELIQHDSSHHLWAPASRVKWYLITSLDDFSRYMFYARLIEKESSWEHISALKSVVFKYGIPYSYYVDSHAIFRFVQGRDSFWRNHYKLTDEAIPQWKQVALDCNIKVIHALSPQAKGKIEKPYGWLQDRIVRTCVREDINDINYAQKILDQEVQRYNYHQVHSTTKEVPYFRFQRAFKEKKSLFRDFTIKPPFQSAKDIFCFRIERTTDLYRKISLNNLHLKVNNAVPKTKVTLRIYPMINGMTEIRFWSKNILLDVQKVKTIDLNNVFTFNS